MLKLSGNIDTNSNSKFSRQIFKVTTNYNLLKVLYDDCIFLNKDGGLHHDFPIQITFNISNIDKPNDNTIIYLDDDFKYLNHDDVIVLDTKVKKIRVLYRVNSPNNYILLTERCNHYCLMCSQPPKNIDDSFLLDVPDSVFATTTFGSGFDGAPGIDTFGLLFGAKLRMSSIRVLIVLPFSRATLRLIRSIAWMPLVPS